jgi:hypothetical protein
MFQVYFSNVSSVPNERCKRFCLDVVKVDLDVAYTCMLQAYVLSVLGVFISMFASVSSRCCICLQWFSNIFQAFSQVFQTVVSSVPSIFLLYAAIVASGCLKSR